MKCEGYGPDYKPRYGGSERVELLKSGIKIRLSDIKSYFDNKDAVADVMEFQRWTVLGFPYSDWARCPNRLVELVEALIPIYRAYHPEDPLRGRGLSALFR
ncbi:MAG TPA: hypothetical protein DCP98_08485 [Sphaerochaeta sp.]|nr:hypothetical protein [Sphaerochaeta sp.]